MYQFFKIDSLLNKVFYIPCVLCICSKCFLKWFCNARQSFFKCFFPKAPRVFIPCQNAWKDCSCKVSCNEWSWVMFCSREMTFGEIKDTCHLTMNWEFNFIQYMYMNVIPLKHNVIHWMIFFFNLTLSC